MPGRHLGKDRRGLTPFMTGIVLLVVFAVVVAVYFGFFAFKPPASGTPTKFVEMKDTVKISYVGYFESGLVFDTSIQSVANDNGTWPKALSFTWRSGYSDFQFTVGKTDCSGGATDCAIIGMSQAVLGLKEGDVTTYTIPPDKGYGQKNPGLVTVRDFVEQVPVRIAMNRTTFASRFGTSAVDGTSIRDPIYGWMAIVHVSGNLVTLENSPEISKSYQLYADKTKGGSWSVTVESIDDGVNNGTGAIKIRNDFYFTSGKRIMITDTSGDFFVTDNGNDTFTVDRNREVVGVNLVFHITIITITKAS